MTDLIECPECEGYGFIEVPTPDIATTDPRKEPNGMQEATELTRLSRDVRDTARFLGREEIHALVDLYYRLQEHRIALGNQTAALLKAERPATVVEHFHDQLGVLERQVVPALNVWTDEQAAGRWAKGQLGIGPVLAAGALAYIDVDIARTAGAVWRFFGLDPSVSWGKGEKRPWCADAKVLAWKIGDSFVKVSGRDDAFYGKVYRDRKRYELDRDDRGGNATTAAKTLQDRNIRDAPTRKIYESGHLPPGRLDLRARRYAAKLFLAHLWEVLYTDHHGLAPPSPYPIAMQGHTHKIDPPAVVPE